MVDFDDWKIYKRCDERQKMIQMKELKRLEEGYYFYKESDPPKAGVYFKEMRRLIDVYQLPWTEKNDSARNLDKEIKEHYEIRQNFH